LGDVQDDLPQVNPEYYVSAAEKYVILGILDFYARYGVIATRPEMSLFER
jgi:hypothetical protein